MGSWRRGILALVASPHWLAEVLDRLPELAALPDAARGEAWVSGLFGELRAVAIDEGRPADELGARLLDQLAALLPAADPPTAGQRAAAGVAAVAARYHEPRLREPAASALAHYLDAGVEPPWPVGRGQHDPLRAWSVVDPAAGSTSIVVEFGIDETADHDVLVDIDADGRLADLQVGPAGLVGVLTAAEVGHRPLEVTALDPTDARRRIVAAVDRGVVGRTDGIVLNHLLLASRFDLGDSAVLLVVDDAVASGVSDPDADAVAVGLLDAALRGVAGVVGPPPPEVADVAASVRAASAIGDPDLASLARVGGFDPHHLDDRSLLEHLAGAYVVPIDLADHPAGERALLAELEWADWLGAVIELVRDGFGTPVDPDGLVARINRCPEVSTSVHRRDAPRVAAAFALTLHAWERSGVLDDQGRLTRLGAWLLPRALARRWGGRFAAPS